MEPKVAVAVSVGHYPATGRSRRAQGDAQALELALRLTPQPLVFHAGEPNEPALRDYLGMGVNRLKVIACPPGSDVLPPLSEELASEAPDILLTGLRAEEGVASGQLPYFLAEKLGASLAPAVTEIQSVDEDCTFAQALPKGRRRQLRARVPTVATVAAAAAQPRQVAFGKARRGQIQRLEPATPPPQADQPEARPARKRPPRLRGTGGTAAERKAFILGKTGGGGRVIEPQKAEEAAQALFDQLTALGWIGEKGAEGSTEAETASEVEPATHS